MSTPENCTEPEASFVVVTWNSAETIGQLLDSIQTTVTVEHEVVVIDNASSDSTCTLVESHRCRPRLIRNSRNLGLAAANNLGMSTARGQWYVICNPDVVLDPGCITELLAAGERHPRAAFVVAKLLHPDGSLQPGVGDLPTLREALAGRQRSLARNGMSGMWWDGWAHDVERPIEHGQEACYLVRRAAVDTVGGQDQRYALDWEGFDWSARMGAANWEIWFCPTATAVHIGGVSVRQVQSRWIRSSHRGMYTYFADRGPRIRRPLLAVLFSTRAAVKTLLLVGRSNAYNRIRLRR